jgi:hypothetical protein
MAHATEPAAASPDMRLQHRLDALPKRQVGIADDPSRDARRAIAAAVAHRGDAGNKLRLADRAQLLWAVGSVHRMTLQKNRGRHLVPAAQIRD